MAKKKTTKKTPKKSKNFLLSFLLKHRKPVSLAILTIIFLVLAIGALFPPKLDSTDTKIKRNGTSKLESKTSNSSNPNNPTATKSSDDTKSTSSSVQNSSSGTSAPTQSTISPVFTVTNATISADSACYATDGSSGYPFYHTFKFNGSITANAAGVVTYKWQPNPPSLQLNHSLNFTGPGTLPVSTTLQLSIPNWQTDYTYGSMQLKIFTPNSKLSNTASVTLDNNPGNIHPCP